MGDADDVDAERGDAEGVTVDDLLPRLLLLLDANGVEVGHGLLLLLEAERLDARLLLLELGVELVELGALGALLDAPALEEGLADGLRAGGGCAAGDGEERRGGAGDGRAAADRGRGLGRRRVLAGIAGIGREDLGRGARGARATVNRRGERGACRGGRREGRRHRRYHARRG